MQIGISRGDAAAGRRYFDGEGKCSGCHSATGDLRAIGARYNPMVLQARMVNPRLIIGDAKPAPPSRVTVRLPDGTVASGVLKEVSDFHVTLTDPVPDPVVEGQLMIDAGTHDLSAEQLAQLLTVRPENEVPLVTSQRREALSNRRLSSLWRPVRCVTWVSPRSAGSSRRSQH